MPLDQIILITFFAHYSLRWFKSLQAAQNRIESNRITMKIFGKNEKFGTGQKPMIVYRAVCECQAKQR